MSMDAILLAVEVGQGYAALGAGIAAIGAGLGIGRTGDLRANMIVAAALVEGVALFAVIICLLVALG